MTEQDKNQEAAANPVELEESELKDSSGGLNFTPAAVRAGDGSVKPGDGSVKVGIIAINGR